MSQPIVASVMEYFLGVIFICLNFFFILTLYVNSEAPNTSEVIHNLFPDVGECCSGSKKNTDHNSCKLSWEKSVPIINRASFSVGSKRRPVVSDIIFNSEDQKLLTLLQLHMI